MMSVKEDRQKVLHKCVEAASSLSAAAQTFRTLVKGPGGEFVTVPRDVMIGAITVLDGVAGIMDDLVGIVETYEAKNEPAG